MKIEQQRGISVTSSVMTFEHAGLIFNLLDTPGHEDFSEDTYRTLTAVDSAVMVIDAAKGIEPQTLKLFEVCRLRSVPIITFINKVDREGRPCFEILDEVADKLALDVCPMSWPVGMGGEFEGLLDFATGTIGRPEGPSREYLGTRDTAAIPQRFADEIELARGGYPEFDLEAFRHGDLTPVYFGSALKNFGVGNKGIELGGVDFEGPFEKSHELFIDKSWTYGVREPFPKEKVVAHVDASGGQIVANSATTFNKHFGVFHQDNHCISNRIFVHFNNLVNPLINNWLGVVSRLFYGDAVCECKYPAFGRCAVNEWSAN